MDDDQLKEKLASWEVRPEIPPDFQRNVWQKIAVRESKPKLSLFGSWDTSWLRPASPRDLRNYFGRFGRYRVGTHRVISGELEKLENLGSEICPIR